MYLTLEGSAGDDIKKNAATMLSIAQQLQISVSSKFNDVELYIGPNGSAERLAAAYKREVATDHRVKMAVG